MRALMARLRGAAASALGEGRDPLGEEIQESLASLRATLAGDHLGARTYGDALSEAHTVCRNLGLGFGTIPATDVTPDVGDLIRYAYAQGWVACESRLAAPNMADAIDLALTTPAAIVEQLSGESLHRWTIRAVQHAVAHGATSERKTAV